MLSSPDALLVTSRFLSSTITQSIPAAFEMEFTHPPITWNRRLFLQKPFYAPRTQVDVQGILPR